MIVVYKETIEENSLFGLNQREHIRNNKHGTIDDEMNNIRSEYGKESELIHGKLGNSVCIVYERVKWYLIRI